MSSDSQSIVAKWLFTGSNWLRSVKIIIIDGFITEIVSACNATGFFTCDVVLPGLIDSGVYAEGYKASCCLEDPFFPERQFAALCLSVGVTTVIDLGSSMAPMTYLSGLSETARGPRMIYPGFRFGKLLYRRGDITLDEDAGNCVASWQGGKKIVSIGFDDERAIEKRLKTELGHELVLYTKAQYNLGMEVPGITYELYSNCQNSKLEWFAPQLSIIGKWTHEELRKAKSFASAKGFLPYAHYFDSEKGLFARKMPLETLERSFGKRPASALLPGTKLNMLAALKKGRCLTSSGSGWPGILPGNGLWDEMMSIEKLSSTEEALRCATGSASEMLAPLKVGTCQVGSRADMLLIDGASNRSSILGLRAGLRYVLISGHVIDADQDELKY